MSKNLKKKDFKDLTDKIEERSLISIRSDIAIKADKKNWNKMIKSLKKALATYNATTEEKLMINLEHDYIPLVMKNPDGSVKILGRLY